MPDLILTPKKKGTITLIPKPSLLDNLKANAAAKARVPFNEEPYTADAFPVILKNLI